MRLFNLERRKKTKQAFSLVEVLVVVFIMSIAFTSFYAVSTFGTKYIIESKNRLAAVALANEKMEIARNLAYDDIGTVGGMINGNIPENEDVIANGRSYHVRTVVEYVDDSFDDVYPTDTIPNDYKVVKIIVSWDDSNGQNKKVESLSRFVPPGLETTVGGAPLVISVSGSDGNGVSQTAVHIVNNDVMPAINTTIQTDNSGYSISTSAPQSSGGYHITISKSGYETIQTMDATASFTPIYPHASVVLGAVNAYSYIQDRLATLTIRSADYQNNPVGSIGFTIEGGKTIGYDASNNPVYGMSNTTGTTGSTSGEKEYADISPGSYLVAMNSNAQYKFVDFDPSTYNPTIAALLPGADMTYTIRVADVNATALMVNVTDGSNSPIAGATATLTDGGGADIFSGKTSSARGVIFYPDGATPLTAGTYTLKVEATGFQTSTQTITINNGAIAEENVQMSI